MTGENALLMERIESIEKRIDNLEGRLNRELDRQYDLHEKTADTISNLSGVVKELKKAVQK